MSLHSTAVLGTALRAARRQRGMTQRQAAVHAEVDLATLASLERGGGTVERLSRVLGILNHRLAEQGSDVALGPWIAARRRHAGLSLERLAKAAGLSKPTVILLERGQGTVASLCMVLDVLSIAPVLIAGETSQRCTIIRAPRCLPQQFLAADCVEAMKEIKTGKIDLVITSPPYNAGKDYENNVGAAEYSALATRWFAEVPRLLSRRGSLWLNVGQMQLGGGKLLPLTYIYYPILSALGLHFRQEIVWHYEGGLAYKSRFTPRTERWMWWTKDRNDFVFHLDKVRDPRLNRTQDQRNNPLGKNPTDYWYYDRVVGGRAASAEKTAHPCQFPVPMVERIMRACSNVGDVILDPFGGSGSTAVAAVKNARAFVSIERIGQFHEIAQQRLERWRAA